MQYLEKLRVDRKIPSTFSALQCALILDYARRRKPQQLAFWACGLFVGLRPGELENITWQAVNLDDGKLTVDASATKIRTRRIVDLEPLAVEWLKFAKEKGGRLPVRHMTRRRYHKQAARLLGLDAWPADVSRHTAASMLLARHKNPNLVSFQLGNSAAVLASHYKNLVSQAEAEIILVIHARFTTA